MNMIHSKREFVNIIYNEFGIGYWKIPELILLFEKLDYNAIKIKVFRYHKSLILHRKPNKALYRISEIGMRLYVS